MTGFSTVDFQDLNTTELYQVLALRSEVFVLEQQCAYQDMDGLDAQCHHILGQLKDGQVIAYARILPPELTQNETVSIGRVVVAADHRKENMGKQLMLFSIKAAQNLFPNHQIEISAQSYLTHFYQNLGFVNTGNFYLEDDIPHQTMIYRPITE